MIRHQPVASTREAHTLTSSVTRHLTASSSVGEDKSIEDYSSKTIPSPDTLTRLSGSDMWAGSFSSCSIFSDHFTLKSLIHCASFLYLLNLDFDVSCTRSSALFRNFFVDTVSRLFFPQLKVHNCQDLHFFLLTDYCRLPFLCSHHIFAAFAVGIQSEKISIRHLRKITQP